MIVLGAIATNRHVAHLDPGVGVGCPFCAVPESLQYLFVQCLRLGDSIELVKKWFSSFGVLFTV